MRPRHGALLCAAALLCGFSAPAAEDGSVRTIRLRQDDAHVRFVSKVYELEHVSAAEILPFVNSAALRYNRGSSVRRVTSAGDPPRNALLVSTGEEFMPYVDAIVAALDRPGKSKDSRQTISGTGVSRVAYTPRYRAASQFSEIIDSTIGSAAGKAYVNRETNTIFWRDQSDAARRTLDWVEKLDRPLPQVNIRLNYYELRDSDLRDWGLDYLAWKNGPGVNLFNVGYNAGQMFVNELLETAQYAATASWGFGGFFTAPQFDMSFIRCLEQSGNATIAASASLTMVNTPIRDQEDYRRLLRHQIENRDKAPFVYRVSMYPEYQNIAKNVLGRTFIGKSFYEDDDGVKHSDPPVLDVRLINPIVCLDKGEMPEKDPAKAKGAVLFSYALYFKNVVERGNTGSELSNSAEFTGAATLGFGVEKVLAIYDKEHDVEQTVGFPILCRIPVLKYIFSTVTSIKERTYIIVTAEALPVHPDTSGMLPNISVSTQVERRIENPLRKEESDEPKTAPEKDAAKAKAPENGKDAENAENVKAPEGAKAKAGEVK